METPPRGNLTSSLKYVFIGYKPGTKNSDLSRYESAWLFGPTANILDNLLEEFQIYPYFTNLAHDRHATSFDLSQIINEITFIRCAISKNVRCIFLGRYKEYDEVIEYCKNDVNATRKFAEECRDLIKLRISQDKQYPDLNLLNKPDSSVGEQLFLYEMSEAMGVDKNELKKLRTPRTTLETRDLLLPYINFKTPEFQKVLDYYQSATYGLMGYNKKKEYKKIPLETTAHFAGIDFEFGEGGIHASWNDRIFEADDEYDIEDIDVTSYYPNLAIRNNFRPQHLGEAFSRVYNKMFQERKKYPKGSPENASYKIVLNGKVNAFGI